MNTVGPVINHPCTLCYIPTSMWCSRCQSAWYCTLEHLQTDWPRHRRECITATHAQNYNMIATPPLAEQQATTQSAVLFEPEAATASPVGSSVCYGMNNLADFWVSESSVPCSRKSAVMSIENNELHTDVLNRRSYALTDAFPIPPEAHKQPTQKQFTDCSPSPCHYSAPNGREHFELIDCGTAPEHFQNIHIIKTSTHGYNDTCHMLDSHDDQMLEHRSGPTSTAGISEGTVQETLPAGSQVDKYDCCPSICCLCTGPEGRVCLQPIDCGVVPNHLRDAHGIKNLARGHLLDCMWRDCGCRVTRHNYVRHIREFHFQHNRNSAHKNPIRCTHGKGEPGRCTGAT